MNMWGKNLKFFPEERLCPLCKLPAPFHGAGFGGSRKYVVEEQDFMTARQMMYVLPYSEPNILLIGVGFRCKC